MQDPEMNQPPQPIDPTHIPPQWTGAPPPPVSSGSGPDFPTSAGDPSGADSPSSSGYPGGADPGNPSGPTLGGPGSPGGPGYAGGPGGPTYPGGSGYGGSYAPRPQISFDVIGEAWQLFQQQMGVWIPAILIAGVVIMALSGVSIALTTVLSGPVMPATPGNPVPMRPMSGVGVLAQVVLGIVEMVAIYVLLGGLYRMALKQVRGQAIAMGDLFSAMDVIGPLVLSAILVTLASYAGLCALCIGMYVVQGLFMFTTPLIVDKGMSATEAMSTSWNTLKGETVMVTLFYFVIALVAGCGALLCGVGALFTMPLLPLAIALTYRNYFLGPGNPVDAPVAGAYPPPPIPSARY